MTAKENVEGFIKVIDENNEEINAFIELNYENALKQAEAIDEKIANGEDVGALAGLVFGIKANINVEDLIISAASKTLEDYYGSYNATVVDEILKEDGIIIGILNMDEFAAGSSTETSYYGPTQNPAAMGRIPGGSSGGCAAAIAAEMCDISIGSDTGGSIRRIQTYLRCRFKTGSFGFIHESGPNRTAGKRCKRYCSRIKYNCKIWRNRMYHTWLGKTWLYRSAWRQIFRRHENSRVSGVHWCYRWRNYYLINYVEFFSATRKYDGRDYGSRIEEVCGEEVLRRIKIGSHIAEAEFSGKYYKQALKARSVIRAEITSMLENVDLIVGPTVPKLPHEIGAELEPMEMYAYDVLTVIANLAGIPAASIPAGEVDGIPVGLQIQAKPLDDEKIIKAMSVFENTQ